MIPSLGALETFRKPKINEVDRVHFFVLANQQILWFDISMHVPMGMHIRNPCEGLIHDRRHLIITKLLVSPGAVLHFMKKVSIGILEYDVNFIFFLVVDHFFEFNQEYTLV